MKAFLVSGLGKYFILNISLFARSPASVRYLGICSVVDSLVSPQNFINFRTFNPLGNSVCKIYSDNAEL